MRFVCRTVFRCFNALRRPVRVSVPRGAALISRATSSSYLHGPSRGDVFFGFGFFNFRCTSRVAKLHAAPSVLYIQRRHTFHAGSPLCSISMWETRRNERPPNIYILTSRQHSPVKLLTGLGRVYNILHVGHLQGARTAGEATRGGSGGSARVCPICFRTLSTPAAPSTPAHLRRSLGLSFPECPELLLHQCHPRSQLSKFSPLTLLVQLVRLPACPISLSLRNLFSLLVR